MKKNINLIPKVIHYCWFGGKELSGDALKCIESWKKYCPDYKIIRWDESNYDYKKRKYTLEAYDAKKWAFVSDVARLDIIYEHGGIYLDTDVELVKSLDELLGEGAFMGFERGRKVATGLGFGAEAGNPIIKANLELYDEINFLIDDNKFNLKPCVEYTTEYLIDLGLICKDQKQELENITIYPAEFFCPYLLSDGSALTTENTFSIHHYAATWCTDEEKAESKKRIDIFTKYGKKGLSAYDGFVSLKKQGIQFFLKRLFEKIKDLFIE